MNRQLRAAINNARQASQSPRDAIPPQTPTPTTAATTPNPDAGLLPCTCCEGDAVRCPRCLDQELDEYYQRASR